MCSIGGCYRREGLSESDVHRTIDMAVRGVCRGRDATGFMVPGSWWKIAIKSPMAVERSGFADWLEENNVWDGEVPWLMFHTRAKTRGSAQVSTNNHPLVHGRNNNGVKLIHNGHVRSPDYYSKIVVDTRSLVYLMYRLRKSGLSLLESVRTAMVSMEGRAAVCATDRYGKEFVIMKDDNPGRSPVHYYWNKEGDGLQWSSTKHISGDCFIGELGKKWGDTREYQLRDWQALWWDGENRLTRVWHLEKHGGRTGLKRTQLPQPVDVRNFAPKSFKKGGKFPLRYDITWPKKTVKPQRRRKSPAERPTMDDVRSRHSVMFPRDVQLTEYLEVSDYYRDDSNIENVVIFPRTVRKNDGRKWYGFEDETWSEKLREELAELDRNNMYVGILRYDAEFHTMEVLLRDNTVRRYVRGVESELSFVEL